MYHTYAVSAAAVVDFIDLVIQVCSSVGADAVWEGLWSDRWRCCRQEVEELRYEQERLKWQLNQAAHLGPSSLPHQPSFDAVSASTSNYCIHAGNDRYVTAKHAAIYPTTDDVSLHYTLLPLPSVERTSGATQ